MDFVKNKGKLNKIFNKNQVILAYLFGSAARGKTTPLSDVDIAVLFSEKVKRDDYSDKRLKLASEIDRAIGIYKTEVVCLNESPPLLKHQVIFYGTPIFISNSELKRNFEFQVLQEYEDFKYHLEVSYKIIARQIKEGTFGKPRISPFSKYLQKYVANKKRVG